MPEIRRYKVTQTREVYVSANTLEGAVRIASSAFAWGQNSDNGVKQGIEGLWGNTDSRVREVDIYAERKQ